ncbi:hypothetical protein R1flu_024443 [Riccia fluitans]|uniref:Uncharacterized protein n=1 Tax=Riccia fluitans TaxID=41844 RepID=A0ABD1XXV3_9MARC
MGRPWARTDATALPVGPLRAVLAALGVTGKDFLEQGLPLVLLYETRGRRGRSSSSSCAKHSLTDSFLFVVSFLHPFSHSNPFSFFLVALTQHIHRRNNYNICLYKFGYESPHIVGRKASTVFGHRQTPTCVHLGFGGTIVIQ